MNPRPPGERESRRYEIRVRGHLGRRWDEWFDGLTVSSEADGTTLISGVVTDQAALHGLLRKVNDIGLPLISVTAAERDDDRATQPESGTRTGQETP